MAGLVCLLSVALQRWESGFAFRWMDPRDLVICFTMLCENAVAGPRGFARCWGFEFSAVLATDHGLL